MVKKAISWALVGAFAYLWWWVGHGWEYLNSEGNEWSRVFMLFTLISLVVLLRGPRHPGTGLLDRLLGSIKGFVPSLPWLVLVIVIMRLLAAAQNEIVYPLEHYVHAVVAALAAGVTTMLWFGAIENAAD